MLKGETNMNIGRIIQKARQGMDMKQEVFAKDLSVTKSCLSLYENEKRDISFPMFMDILKTFGKHGQHHLVSSILDDIREEVWQDTRYQEGMILEMKRNDRKTLAEKGYTKITDLDDTAVGKMFFDRLVSRETEYYVKDFKNANEEDIMVFFFHNELGTRLIVLQETSSRNMISKTKFETELEKEDANYQKYNGNIPDEELFCFDPIMMEVTALQEGLASCQFSSDTLDVIQSDFDIFYKIYN